MWLASQMKSVRFCQWWCTKFQRFHSIIMERFGAVPCCSIYWIWRITEFFQKKITSVITLPWKCGCPLLCWISDIYPFIAEKELAYAFERVFKDLWKFIGEGFKLCRNCWIRSARFFLALTHGFSLSFGFGTSFGFIIWFWLIRFINWFRDRMIFCFAVPKDLRSPRFTKHDKNYYM